MSAETRASDRVKAFFANSDLLDRLVLRPLAHILSKWETTWDRENFRYALEEDSFAGSLNVLIDELASVRPPRRYHESEDALAQYVIEKLKWPIRNERGRWVGADYLAILEQGGFNDLDQHDLMLAAAGRIQAAIERGQLHFDDMEVSHCQMLAGVLSTILYHRS